MFFDDLEPLEKSFYRPKNQYSRLEQIVAVLIVFLPVATVPLQYPLQCLLQYPIFQQFQKTAQQLYFEFPMTPNSNIWIKCFYQLNLIFISNIFKLYFT